MLDSIFNLDNPFFKFMNRVADVIVLDLIFVISCIPIITIGPALTALNYVAINAWRRGDGYVWQMYKKSFKENFKQGVLMWLIMLFVGSILSVDVWFWVTKWKSTGDGMYKPLTVVSVVLLVIYLIIFTYVWPLLAKFSNTIKGTIKNAFAMAITHVPETIGVWLIFGAAAFLVYLITFIRMSGFLYMFGLVAYLQALLFRRVFKPYLNEVDKLTPEEEADRIGYENNYAEAKLEVAKIAEEMKQKEEAEASDESDEESENEVKDSEE